MAANFQFWKELPALVRLWSQPRYVNLLGSFLACNCLTGKGRFGARDRPSKGKGIGYFHRLLVADPGSSGTSLLRGIHTVRSSPAAPLPEPDLTEHGRKFLPFNQHLLGVCQHLGRGCSVRFQGV